MNLSQKEKKLLELVKGQRLSASHSSDHLLNVAQFGIELCGIYQGKRELVVASAFTHDLGRIDTSKRGKDSALRGKEMAKPLLQQAGYEPEEVGIIERIISEHDQADFHSPLLESRILKDADFLDGFGARGILRSLIYAGETGGGVKEAIARLMIKMRQRLDGLEFVESKRMGWKLYRFVELFLEQLEFSGSSPGLEFGKRPGLSDSGLVDLLSYPGKLVVLEGISGAGKDTQAQMLADKLAFLGKQVLVVHHPTAEFKQQIWPRLREMAYGALSELLCLVADRAQVVKNEVEPALKAGKIVISTRSQLSAEVYQAMEEVPASWQRWLFAFEPVADALIYIDVTSENALERADERIKLGREKDRGFFGSKQEAQRKLYEEAIKHYPNLLVVDGNGARDEVHKKIWFATKDLFS